MNAAPVLATVGLWLGPLLSGDAALAVGRDELDLNAVGEVAAAFAGEPETTGEFTWWMPPGADRLVLPLVGGVAFDRSDAGAMSWLRRGSPWGLTGLPVIGLGYGNEQLVVILPWPHYAGLVLDGDRVGVRFSFPEGRRDVAPAEIVAMRRPAGDLEAAFAFRDWRESADETGAIPRRRSFASKVGDLPRAGRLLGAPHFYLWGPARFCRHDVPRNRWLAFAKALAGAPGGTFGHQLAQRLTADERRALDELAGADWPAHYLTTAVAGGIDRAMAERGLLELGAAVALPEVVRENQQALANWAGGLTRPPESWGDGFSTSLLDSVHAAGVERAAFFLSDLYARAARPAVARHAESLGYLIGPYDSYHSVHSPEAGPDDTWETAQFDTAAYEGGRVVNADGTGHAGFKGRGFHFSPQAAWPYVQRRVGGILTDTPFSAWFVDCDATAECFDDYSAGHPADRYRDTSLRRDRLRWLESNHGLVVASEGGSVLFSDVIHVGHGVHTPYIGHLDPQFRDRGSPHFLGRHWPPDSPEQSFKPVPLPPSLRSPYFDPAVRVPLYRAAVGDELVNTHHWSFDSLKFDDVAATRELLDILYLVPPMYHLNRSAWPERREKILRHLAFWGPLHERFATARLTAFRPEGQNRELQSTRFEGGDGERLTITVNFSERVMRDFPPRSATAVIAGARPQVYLVPEDK